MHADLLLVTVTKVESLAVLDAFEKHTGKKPRIEPRDGKTYHELGTVNGARVWLVLSEMGASGLGGAQQTVTKALAEFRPAAAGFHPAQRAGMTRSAAQRTEPRSTITSSRTTTDAGFASTLKLTRASLPGLRWASLHATHSAITFSYSGEPRNGWFARRWISSRRAD